MLPSYTEADVRQLDPKSGLDEADPRLRSIGPQEYSDHAAVVRGAGTGNRRSRAAFVTATWRHRLRGNKSVRLSYFGRGEAFFR